MMRVYRDTLGTRLERLDDGYCRVVGRFRSTVHELGTLTDAEIAAQGFREKGLMQLIRVVIAVAFVFAAFFSWWNTGVDLKFRIWKLVGGDVGRDAGTLGMWGWLAFGVVGAYMALRDFTNGFTR